MIFFLEHKETIFKVILRKSKQKCFGIFWTEIVGYPFEKLRFLAL